MVTPLASVSLNTDVKAADNNTMIGPKSIL
ncbi:hypothetical protein DZA64_001404 [Clostridium beijerinckii]|nr:hypothetical protein [Clostridium beijerinckii]NRW93646.1 hypothetical protein [Clostridium beijerinckii]NRY69640.1 hypothetical protein [Clostridium beijerinckii]NRY84555.1 hypothetical protein [Clostridium beijerinckii]NRZ49501.1 hypothetical protein [Clostridium beijerinckii]